MNKYSCVVLLVIMLMDLCAASDKWSFGPITGSDTWSISRERGNLTFTYDQSVQGVISPVAYRNGNLSPYHSQYAEIIDNDVSLSERTSALDGALNASSDINLNSHSNNSTLEICVSKPLGSDVYAIGIDEDMPVLLTSNKSIHYSGRQINYQEHAGNNGDIVGSVFNYNKEFSKERSLDMKLDRLNIAIFVAEDGGVLDRQIKATRHTQYKTDSHSTGIFDFKWRQIDDHESVANGGEERFIGDYDISKNISMMSYNDRAANSDEWMPCCSGGYFSMSVGELKDLGFDAEGVFDCTCSKYA